MLRRGAILLLAVTTFAGDARADVAAELARAEELKANLQYDGALAALERALSAGTSERVVVAQIYRLRGELLAGLGRVAVAEDSFAHYLALEPNGQLAAGASPKLTKPFARARQRLGGAELSLTTTVDGDAATAVVVDPTKLVRRIETVGGAAIEPPYLIDLSGGPVVVIARDRHGNSLVRTPPIEREVVSVRTNERSAIAQPLPWAIGSAALGATAVTFAILARSDQSELDDLIERAEQMPFSVSFDEIDEVRSRGKQRALVANVTGGLAVAAAATSVVLWWVGRDDESTELAVSVTGDGAAFAVQFGF